MPILEVRETEISLVSMPDVPHNSIAPDSVSVKTKPETVVFTPKDHVDSKKPLNED